jgi:hypothetical protein
MNDDSTQNVQPLDSSVAPTSVAAPSAAPEDGIPPPDPTTTPEPCSEPPAGGGDHLDPRIRAMLDDPKHKRVQHILADRLIMYDGLDSILNRIHWLVQEPRTSRARGEMYVGPPGSGKSSIALIIQKAYPLDVRDFAGNPKPKAVAISISGARTTKAVLNRILVALGVPTTNRTTGDLEEVVIDTLLRANCRLLIVDEMQDLRQIRESEQLRVLETLKNLMNRVRLSVLGLGDARAEKAFDADPHIRARFSTYAIPAWKEGDDFGDFLSAYERHLPLRYRSSLARPQIQKILLKVTGGQLDGMLRRIKAAALQAIVDGTERITPEMLADELPRPPVHFLNGLAT